VAEVVSGGRGEARADLVVVVVLLEEVVSVEGSGAEGVVPVGRERGSGG